MKKFEVSESSIETIEKHIKDIRMLSDWKAEELLRIRNIKELTSFDKEVLCKNIEASYVQSVSFHQAELTQIIDSFLLFKGSHLKLTIEIDDVD